MARSRKLTALIVVAAVAAVAGGAYAATGASTKQQPFLSDVAHRLGVSPARLDSALRGAFDDRLSAAVAAGRLTKAQAAAIEQRMARGGSYGPGIALVAPAVALGHGGARAKLFQGGAPGVGGMLPFGIGFGLGGSLRTVSSYLGITRAQLLAQLASGKSIAEIASAHGKTVAGVKAAVSAALIARLDRAVAAGRITHSQEQKLIANAAKFETAALSAHVHFGMMRSMNGIRFGRALRRLDLRKGHPAPGWFGYWGAPATP